MAIDFSITNSITSSARTAYNVQQELFLNLFALLIKENQCYKKEMVTGLKVNLLIQKLKKVAYLLHMNQIILKK